MCRQLLFKSSHKKLKNAYKKLKSAYKNHIALRKSHSKLFHKMTFLEIGKYLEKVKDEFILKNKSYSKAVGLKLYHKQNS